MMQPHTGEQSCSYDTTGSHQEESSTAARHEEAEFQEEQDEESGEINMSLASTIPSQVMAGSLMDTPLVVLLHRGTKGSTAIDDIWVFVSLVDADTDSESSGREMDDVLKGQRADNAHPMLGYLNTRDNTFAYASFSNLLISRSGSYRLRVTAIDMSQDQSYVLPAITSDAFQVVDSIPIHPDVNTDGLRHLTLADLRAR